MNQYDTVGFDISMEPTFVNNSCRQDIFPLRSNKQGSVLFINFFLIDILVNKTCKLEAGIEK